MGTLSLTLPTIGQLNSTEDVKIPNALSAVQTFVNGANFADTQLESPTSPVWRTVFNTSFVVANLTTTPAYFTVAGLNSTTTSASVAGLWIPSVAADEAVAGKTTRLRTRICWGTNAVAPGITITWGLYPVQLGGSGNFAPTLGTVVTGSTAAVVTPALTTGDDVTSSTYDLSTLNAASQHVPGVVGSGSQTANSMIAGQFILEMRHT